MPSPVANLTSAAGRLQEDAKLAFKQLLASVGMRSDWSWEQAMRVIVNDGRCASSVCPLCARNQFDRVHATKGQTTLWESGVAKGLRADQPLRRSCCRDHAEIQHLCATLCRWLCQVAGKQGVHMQLCAAAREYTELAVLQGLSMSLQVWGAQVAGREEGVLPRVRPAAEERGEGRGPSKVRFIRDYAGFEHQAAHGPLLSGKSCQSFLLTCYSTTQHYTAATLDQANGQLPSLQHGGMRYCQHYTSCVHMPTDDTRRGQRPSMHQLPWQLNLLSLLDRLKKSREDFVKMLESAEDLSRFSKARELFEDDPRWRVR